MKIVVIGGTGLIGSKVVAQLRAQGRKAVPASPSTGVNVLTGEGLDAVLRGAEIVVDLANSPSFDEASSVEFFQTAGRNLLAAAANAGVGKHVALSIVGTASNALQASGYIRAKCVQENLIRDSAIPYTIVHTTQFFEYLPEIIASAVQGSTVRLPPARVQPIAAEDVATAMAYVALQPPAQDHIEIAGPEVEPLASLARRFMILIDDPRDIVTDVHAPYYGAQLGNDTLLPTSPAWQGTLNFERWLGLSEFAADMPREVMPYCRP